MADRKPTGGKRTKNAVPFASQLDPSLAEEFNDRVAAERRTKRAVLEAALRHYMGTVPVNGGGEVRPASPRRGKAEGGA